MDVLIKREDAIRALKREKSDWNYDYNVPIDNCIKRLSKVKPADTEIEIIKAEAFAKGIDSERKRISDWCRPSGEWIDRSDGGRILNPWWETYECSKCGQYGTRIWDYCPNCGSKMRGEHDD